MRAIAHAYTILSWQENLPKTEMPPEWMWSLDEPIEEWFEEVEAVREDRNAGGRANQDTDVPLMQNMLAAGRKRR